MASLLRDDRALLAEIDSRLTSYLKGKVDRLQGQYDSI